VKYPDAAEFRQALEQRLKTRAGGDGARLARDRKRVAFDRLLARLTITAPERWLLKGGFALDLRLVERARATKDIDIDWHAAEEELLDTLLDAAEHETGDFFDFAVERTGTPGDRLGGSHRFRIATSLAGRQFETFLLDVGFRNEQILAVEMLTTQDLLAFAGIDPVRVPTAPLELQVAEKLHAYTRTYEGSRPSTRTKDLVDLALIAELSPLEAAALREAIETTFARRTTHPVPTVLPAPPRAWRTAFRQLAEAVGLPPELEHGHANPATLLDPVLKSADISGAWDPGTRRWLAVDR
jgi:hypothetical protein